MKIVIDEVLNGEPKFNIIDNTTGEIIYKDVKIELSTEILQDGTPINKALFDSIRGDVYRIDKYSKPEYAEGIKSVYQNKNGAYIGLWGNSKYSKYGINVYSNSEDGENYAYKAMNGVEGYWSGANVPTIATPTIFDISLGKKIRLNKFKIRGANSELYCKTFKLLGSNDGENYYDIQAITNNTPEENEYTNSDENFYSYYRLSITASGSATALPAILEFNITDWDEYIYYNQVKLDGITLTEYESNQRLLLDLVDECNNEFLSNILPPFKQTNQDGYMIQSSGDYINTSIIDAFDYDNDNTYWRSLETQEDRYIMVTMPINVIPSMFTIKLANVMNGSIEGSNDGDNWDILAEGIETTDGETVETKEIEIETTKRYRMFRFAFKAKVENTSSMVYVFDITRGFKGGYNYNRETYVNINGLGDVKVSNDSISKEGNYELVYIKDTNSYIAYLMSFERATLENTFTNAEKEKLAGIEVGAEVNVIDGIKINGAEKLPDSNKVINVEGVEETKNKVKTLNDSDESYPTCGAVKKALNLSFGGLEETKNKTTELTNSDVEYPTCGAVSRALENVAPEVDLTDYATIEYVNNVLGNIETLLASI